MKAKKGFKIRKICGQNLIVAEGKENIDFSSIISMNESSALLWNAIQDKEFTTDELADILQNNYEIDEHTPLPRKQAMDDASSLVNEWIKIGIVEP